MYGNIIKENIGKYLLIVFCSFIFVAGGSLLENRFRPKDLTTKIDKTKIHCEQIFAIINKRNEKSNIFLPVTNNGYFKVYSFLTKFYNNTKDNFEYNKFCKNWDNFKQEEQLIWLNRHILISNLSTDIIACTFILENNDNRDYEYSNKYAQKIFKQLCY